MTGTMDKSIREKLIVALAITLTSAQLQEILDVDFTRVEWEQIILEALSQARVMEGKE